MHQTTSTASQTRRRLVFLTLLAALLLLALAQAAPSLGAAADYTGGPQAGDYPLYVANDHSVYTLRFSAAAGTLLDASGTAVTTAGAQYYVKLRISPTVKPSGGTSRGFIWNATTQQWVQERDDWSSFPIVTTGAGGAIVPGNTWTYFKFGDTTKPGATDSASWYLLVTLKPIDGLDQTTQNNASPPPVTITDMTGALPGALTSAFRIHNGVATGSAVDARRIEATASGLTDVWSLSRTENNQVAQGYGSSATGDFDVAVPVGMAFDAKIQSVIWPASAASFTGSLADVDVALGAADTTPPAAPASLAATPSDGHVGLSWDAVADVASYTVYKWQAATPIGGAINYTPQHMAVDTVTETTYDAAGLTNGETYFFEVRASDAATNIGPPSSTQTTVPKADSQLTLQTTASTVNWGGEASLTGELTDGAETFAAGQQVRLERSYNGTTWTLLQMLDPATPFTYGLAVEPTQKTRYRLVFEGDATHATATSLPVTVTPRVKLGTPAAPSAVMKGSKFTVYGHLVPRHSSGSRIVKIKCYLKKSGAWKLQQTATATNRNYKTYSRYSAKFALTARGSWKLVASTAASAKYASTTSGAKYLKVK